MRAATVLLSLLVSMAALAGLGSAAPRLSSTSSAPLPLATVVQHGGLCFMGKGRPGKECRSTVTITDRWISAPGFKRRALKETERARLLGAIRLINADYLRRRPLRSVCPTASDGQESLYRFRGFELELASCTYDLARVRAVTLVNRLIRQLER